MPDDNRRLVGPILSSVCRFDLFVDPPFIPVLFFRKNPVDPLGFLLYLILSGQDIHPPDPPHVAGMTGKHLKQPVKINGIQVFVTVDHHDIRMRRFRHRKIFRRRKIFAPCKIIDTIGIGFGNLFRPVRRPRIYRYDLKRIRF